MCGICGIFDLKGKKRIVDSTVIKKMTRKLLHRGPDGVDYYTDGDLTFGFSRLSIIDLEGGMQPLFSEDGSIIMICNGEIFNYIELRWELLEKGHRFKTRTDVEVIIHLYEESGREAGFLNQLNGQFAFALYDFKKQQLFCARDHFGVIPFFYTTADDFFIFGSEIKAILEHPLVEKAVDLVGLDQVFSFPGLISPRTMFKHIKSLDNGHYLQVSPSAAAGVTVNVDDINVFEYWDVIYPQVGEIEYHPDEIFYIEQVEALLTQSVKLRLRADVPVGFYISGGLDSSLISAMATTLTPAVKRYSFSIDFEEKDKSEAKYQQSVADFIHSIHSEKMFYHADIAGRLQQAVYHSEYPLKETYNTASLALSESARQKNIKVVLSGEGADEWFAGYPGYKFDKFRNMQKKSVSGEIGQKELNERLWGDENLNFEMNLYDFEKVKRNLYSQRIQEIFAQVDALQHKVVNIKRLQGRDILHKRSYLDYKLRLITHLIADHGDRMAYANSVEGRYPFLDKNLVEFAVKIPPDLKLKEFEEKYILKKVAENRVPPEIIRREKFAFHAPGSPYLLRRNIEYIHDLISLARIKRQGYFNPDTVEKLKNQYMAEGFRLNIPYEIDLLIIVISFGIFLDVFGMST
ncbi:MAG: asparagine synthase (glutamine-hydrolyzing) [Candidatus Aminicenantes bacterium]|nr:asparagine synthase (glutamine-hydrolyzing) [Candidatus Aminicenantes bacterium]NIM82437.1 asparagine synthase (glutamine-hydrolyzing) [Candidatus Aminicenantes bacterium]NIN21798.1 asparagine synthase (glutamine-hydrolyzing) [Candidatus Aminicenantes bacterium]NIN45590.1 asparagine synthase (glutamine-hydrolyzing) [Candidatus Aminicenantes bacterium]NIN88421.1 asparagine synthase (glutamine-hydrolyzing) [Candidatus Aminicenantes bacterium]